MYTQPIYYDILVSFLFGFLSRRFLLSLIEFPTYGIEFGATELYYNYRDDDRLQPRGNRPSALCTILVGGCIRRDPFENVISSRILLAIIVNYRSSHFSKSSRHRLVVTRGARVYYMKHVNSFVYTERTR